MIEVLETIVRAIIIAPFAILIILALVYGIRTVIKDLKDDF